jgi:hypothetical protein
MIKARTSPSFGLRKRERRPRQAALQSLPEEAVARIQSAGCKAQKKSIIGAHNKCWKYLLCAITKSVLLPKKPMTMYRNMQAE